MLTGEMFIANGEMFIAKGLELSSITVGIVKAQIENQTGIPSNQQQLRFSERILEDSYTLSDYNFKYDSSLLLVMQYQG